MAENTKTLRVAIEVDKQGAQQARNFIQDLTRDVNKLVEAAQRAAASMGGGNAPTVTQNGPVGSGRPPTPGAQRGGGILGAAAGAIGAGSQELKGVLQGTTQTFQQVQAGLANFVNKAVSDVERLTRAVGGLQRSFGGVSGSIPRMGGGSNLGGGGQTLDDVLGARFPAGKAPALPGPLGARPGRIPGYRDETTTDLELLEEEGLYHPNRKGGAMAKGGRGGSPIQSFLGSRVASGMQSLGIPGSGMVGNWIQAGLGGGAPIGLAGGLGLGVSAAALVGVGLMQAGGKALEGQYGASLDWERNEQLRRLQRAAAIAAPARQAVGASYGGDITYLNAQRAAMNDPKLRATLGNVKLNDETVMTALGERDFSPTGAGASLWRQYVAPNLAGGMSKVLGGLEAMFKDPAARRFQGMARGGTSELQYKLSKAILDTQPQLAGEYEAATQANIGLTDPVRAMAQNEVYQQALNRVAVGRQGYFGGGQYRKPDGTTGDTFLDLQARLRATGRTEGEFAAGRRQTMSTAGLGYLGKIGALETTSMAEGGLTGGDALLRAGGILGGSREAGVEFLRHTVQGSVGRDGLDPLVGGELFGQLAGRAQQTGQFGAGDTFARYAEGAASVIAGGAGAPLDVAQQQRRAQQFQTGAESYNAYATGKAAPLYEAYSQLASIDAAGGYGLQSEALARADRSVLQGVARGGDVPDYLKSLGITSEMAQTDLRKLSRIGLAEIPDQIVPKGTYAGDLVGAVRERERSGGSFIDVLKDRMSKAGGGIAVSALNTRQKGETEKQFRARQAAEQGSLTQDVNALGGVRFAAGLENSADAGAGFWLSQLAGDPDLFEQLQGKGAHGTGPNGLDKTALKDQGRGIKDKSKVIGDFQDELHKDFQTDAARAGGRAGVAAAANTLADETATVMATAVARVAQQLDLLAGKLERFGAPATTRAPTSKPVKGHAGKE